MLYDFMMLETYYGPSDAALYLEELSLRYGIPAIQKALAAGDLVAKRILCGPNRHRTLFWLSEKGRAGLNAG